MTHEFIPLREQLARISPELHAALMRSWQIAEKEWLPAVTGNKGSFNSFPHLYNLEQYADDIFRQSESLHFTGEKLELTGVEIYILLAAILFHDIGRTIQGKWHAHASRTLIRENFADLGIEGKNLAFILADICCYHDCTPAIRQQLDLRDHSVSPYGVIHCKRLAVVLRFIDNLDAAYTRVLPHYLHSDETNLIEGFRRNTSDVRVDLRNHMVVTTINFDRARLMPNDTSGSSPSVRSIAFEVPDTGAARKIPWERLELTPNVDAPHASAPGKVLRACFDFFEALARSPKDDAAYHELEGNGSIARYVAAIELLSNSDGIDPNAKANVRDLGVAIGKNAKVYRNCCRDKGVDLRRWGRKLFFDRVTGLTRKKQRKFLRMPGGRCPFGTVETGKSSYLPLPIFKKDSPATAVVPYVLLRNIAFAELGEYGKIADLSRLVFLALAGNVRCNARLLKKDLEGDLAIYGLPVRAWLIEYDEHLFTCAGKETFEPSLSKDLLKEVVDCMCYLSGGMFNRNPCTYRTLAAKLRVGDVHLVRTAVRRIAIVSRHKKHGKKRSDQSCYSIQFTQRDWRWCPWDEHLHCKRPNKHAQNWMLKQIEKLAEPNANVD